MKKIFKKIIFFLLFVLMLTPVYAETMTKDLFYLEESYHMAVSIRFDREMPDVSFETPNGNILSGNSLQKEEGSGWVQYYLPNAERGQWKIIYDRKSNQKFEVYYSSYMKPISIQHFSFSKVEELKLKARFSVSGESGKQYEWKLSAVLQENGKEEGSRMLLQGDAEFDKEQEVDVDLYPLKNYPRYHLLLEVWQTEGVEEAFDSRAAQGSFAVTGNPEEKLKDFSVEVNLTEREIIADWKEWRSSSVYLVGFFDVRGQQEEEILVGEFAQGLAEAEFPKDCKEIRIEITERSDSNRLRTISKKISLATGVKAKIIAKELGNEAQAMLQYEVPRPMEVLLKVNNQSEKLHLKDRGSFSFSVPELENTIRFEYQMDDSKVKYYEILNVVVDRIPPILRLPEHKEAISVTAEEFLLAGLTEPGAKVTVNDAVAETDLKGAFLFSVKLEMGLNTLKVRAEDETGNITAQDVLIHRVSSFAAAKTSNNAWDFFQKYREWMFAFVALLGTLLIVLPGIRKFRRAERKGPEILNGLGNLSFFFCIFFLAISLYYYRQYSQMNNSVSEESFFDVAGKSVQTAFTMMGEVEKYRTKFFFSVTGLGISLFIALVLVFIKKYFRKHSQRKAGDSRKKRAETKYSVDPLPEIPAELSPTTDSQPAVKETASKNGCPKCGTIHQKAVLYCSKCGTEMEK